MKASRAIAICFGLLTSSMFSLPAFASSAPPPKKDAHGAKDKNAAKDAKPEDDKEAEEAKLKSQRETYEVTTRYKHTWIKLPSLAGRDIFGDDTISHKPIPGYVSVIFFLASWCEPCQKITPDILALQKKFKNLPVHFIYVFTSDTLQDAQGFAKEYKVPTGLLANHDILRDFHGPELPTIYVGDRNNWIAKRYLKADDASLKDLENYLTLMTGV